MNSRAMIAVLTAAFLALIAVGCSAGQSSRTAAHSDDAATNAATAPAASAADAIQPLGVGDRAPDATLTSIDGRTQSFSSIYKNHPTIVIFYRGGWCPYCNRHLSDVATAQPTLRELGYQIIAISPDKPEELRKTMDKDELAYQLFSDSDMTLARRFGVAFVVDDATIEKYHGYGIDLERSSGRNHHELPVPSVYILDQHGMIHFAHSNPDYRVRMSADEIIDAATKAAGAK